jgi:ubiquinone/menaquinone biosynthesis C-methylase UbiE
MTSDDDSEYIAMCCADIYNHPLVLKLLDGVLHPGGVALTAHLAIRMGVSEYSNLLDIACGDGRTAVYLAKKYNCQVTGIDAGQELIDKAIELAKRSGVEENVQFYQSILGKLQFDNESFDSIVSECSFCTFPNKENAAHEVYRILKPNGVLGITDVTLENNESLHPELQSLLGRVLCIADAVSLNTYIDLFEKVGFKLQESSSHSNLLEELVNQVISNARMLQATDLTHSVAADIQNNLEQAVRFTKLIENEVHSGNLGYDLLIFNK